MQSTLSILKRIRQDVEDSGKVSIPRLLRDLDTAIENEERILGQLGAVALGMRKLQSERESESQFVSFASRLRTQAK